MNSSTAYHNSKVFFSCVITVLIVLVLHAFQAYGESQGTEPVIKDVNPGWEVGYWVWNASYNEHDRTNKTEKIVSVLYVESQEYYGPSTYKNGFQLRFPRQLPSAEKYMAVVRFAEREPPPLSAVQELVKSYLSMKQTDSAEKRNIIGLQIDYDCPTKKLAGYAAFLRELKKSMPQSDILSVTAVLDWFTKGTDVGIVIQASDEFVPQFYDAEQGSSSARLKNGIGKDIDPSWAGVFNSFGKPYRIGVSCFGRILGISKVDGKKKNGKESTSISNEEIDILTENPIVLLSDNKLQIDHVTANKTGERLIFYKNKSALKPKTDFFREKKYHTVLQIIPTQASVLNAYRKVQAMGGYCRGVLFFRWPTQNEAMTLNSSEIDQIISGERISYKKGLSLETEDGLCATVSCMDLYVRLENRFPEFPVKIRIRSSRDLEYVIPDPVLKTVFQGPRSIDVVIPPYSGVPRIHIVKAVSIDPSEFRIEEVDK